MTLRVGSLTMDAVDCARLARFWADALEWVIVDEKRHAAYLVPKRDLGRYVDNEGSVPGLLLLHSPDPKMVKNRLPGPLPERYETRTPTRRE